ncbi:NAD-dependent epimerase/dehydratase family protein, partial [Gluconobacter morbifer]|uniref:NAD-dependent epimerase/dehydratase family protein n=1 Tax=Gluconobacter morbifer TaxID=479935 RepID=UPI0005901DE7
MTKILITGVAGFIGSHVAQAFLDRGTEVIGIDTLNDYYDPALKKARLARLAGRKGFGFQKLDIADRDGVQELIGQHPDIEGIVHLAAQAGVRYSLVDPYSYVNANVMGQVVLLEAARKLNNLRHFVYASSSSVYGRNRSLPFRETDRVDEPGSLYAVTKRAGELASSAYAYLHGLPLTGLRFFTVYGPWGRPDMAYYGFARAIWEGRPLTLYDGDGLARDFTYIDDITSGVLAVFDRPPLKSERKARVLNLGGDCPQKVTRLIDLLESNLGKKAVIHRQPRPAADMESTWASLDEIERVCGWKPVTNLPAGVERFCHWFREFHA